MSCQICGNELTGRQSEACSRSCRIKLDGMKRREAGRLRKANMTAEQLARKAIRDTRWRQQYKTWQCVTCGRGVTVGNVYKAGYWCSQVCKYSYWAKGLEASRTKDLELKPEPIRIAKLNVLRGGWWTAGECKICGELFVSQYRARTCSAPCQEANEPKGEWIDPTTRYSIYHRDGWACHLCNKPVPRNLQWCNEDWQPDYPTLDHIVPRSHGGTDDPSNLRLAHMYCNSIRGSTPLGTTSNSL